MKKLLLIPAFFYCCAALAQSPGLTIKLRMDSVKANGIHFNIEMKLCEPVKRSKVNGYFTNDRSIINFKKLSENDIVCESYIENGDVTNPYLNYRFSNQVFAWEKIIVWKINASTRDWRKPMYVILPVKIKSFVTFVEIADVEFEEGKFIWLDDEGRITTDKTQHLSVSLKNRKGIDIDKCTLKKILN
jgi:hypothetical protein